MNSHTCKQCKWWRGANDTFEWNEKEQEGYWFSTIGVCCKDSQIDDNDPDQCMLAWNDYDDPAPKECFIQRIDDVA